MGCASSKVLGGEADRNDPGVFSKAIGVPALPQNLPNDFHVVALTSSTYGILKVDAPKPAEEDCKGAAIEASSTNSVKDVLNKLSKLENKEDAGPQSWLEVSSMLENLKPELEKPTNAKSGGKLQHLDSIDIKDMMLDLDEDTGLVRPKARKLADLKKAGKSLPIRTLEELDKRLGGKPGGPKNGVSASVTTIAEARALLKPVATHKVSTSVDGKTETDSKELSAEQKPGLSLDKQKPDLSAHGRDGVVRRDSELVDDDFLQSYKNAESLLSEDEWKVVEALCDREEQADAYCKFTDVELETINKNMGMEQQEEDAAKMSCESEDIFSLLESSSLQGSSTMGSSSTDLQELAPDSPASEGIAERSPLEEYEELCPPGGKEGVVLYTTGLRSIRRTYEDCVKAREMVKSCGVVIDERDVSRRLEYRNELRELMQRVVTVPRLFVRGRYIGGAEVIAKLAEDGQLAGLFEDARRGHGGSACIGCAGAKVVTCLDCSGSCKVVNDKKKAVRCPECNEDGLIHCPICC